MSASLSQSIGNLITNVARLRERVRNLENIVAQLARKKPQFGNPQVGPLNPIHVGLHTVYVTSSIPAATEGVAGGKRYVQPQIVAVRPAEAHPTQEGAICMGDDFIPAESRWRKPVTVSSGKAKLAEMLNGRLISIDCEEVTP